MGIKVLIRVDDVSDRFDVYDLKKWFLSRYPQIPVCFYAMATQYRYRWRKKGWNLVKDLIINHNWEIGGHTRNHPHLPKLTDVKLKEEIVDNLYDIRAGLKSVGLDYQITSFAYPYGELDSRVKNILKENGIIHGLTYISDKHYKSQLIIPDNKLEIGISCNAKNNVDDWNNRFEEAYLKGDVYVICLHTPLWTKTQFGKNLKRVLNSKSGKELYISSRRLFKNIFKKGEKFYWNLLKQHLDFIVKHSEVQFTTLKGLEIKKNLISST